LEFAEENNFSPNFKNSKIKSNLISYCYKHFLKVIKYDWNISYTNPCYFECKVCFLYKNHKTSQNCEINCQNCLSYNLHIEEVKIV
jgi:hypothetical protein